MTPKDRNTIAAVTVLVAALAGLLATIGVSAQWIATVAALAPIVTGVAIWSVNAYVRVVGADNTKVDEAKDTIEDLVLDAADEVRPANQKPPKPPLPPTAAMVFLLALGAAACGGPCSPKTAAAFDSTCAGMVVEVLEESCPGKELDDCPAAKVALIICDEAIARHAAECAK